MSIGLDRNMEIATENVQQTWQQHPYASLYAEILLGSTEKSETEEAEISQNQNVSRGLLCEDALPLSIKPTKAEETLQDVRSSDLTHSINTELSVIHTGPMDCSTQRRNALNTSTKCLRRDGITAFQNQPKVSEPFAELLIESECASSKKEQEKCDHCSDAIQGFVSNNEKNGYNNRTSSDDSIASMDTIQKILSDEEFVIEDSKKKGYHNKISCDSSIHSMETIDYDSQFRDAEVIVPSNVRAPAINATNNVASTTIPFADIPLSSQKSSERTIDNFVVGNFRLKRWEIFSAAQIEREEKLWEE